jgi:hypothetical protein
VPHHHMLAIQDVEAAIFKTGVIMSTESMLKQAVDGKVLATSLEILPSINTRVESLRNGTPVENDHLN